MRDPQDYATCLSKRGLLVLRDCGRPAAGSCTLCGRPVCMLHQVAFQGSNVCPECYAREKDQQSPEDPRAVSSQRNRDSYYDQHDYRPIYIGSSHYYSDRDYRTFDDVREAGQSQRDRGQAASGSDSGESAGMAPGDLDHYMES